MTFPSNNQSQQHSSSTESKIIVKSWHYGLLLAFILITSFFSLLYSHEHFSVDSDLNHLVKQDAPWRDNLDKTTKEFGNSESNLIVVISGDDREQVQAITEQLTHDFSDKSIFKDIFSPSTLPWFQQQALWFLSEFEFKGFTQNVEALLPRLQVASQAQNSTDQIEAPKQFLAQVNDAVISGDDKAAKLLIQSLYQIADPNINRVNWFSLLYPDSQKTSYQVISLNAEPDRTQKEPNRFIMHAVNEVIEPFAGFDHIDIRITGQTALDFDEIQDANHSVKLAGTMSLIGLIVVLGFGIRSIRIIAASYAAVIVGLIWTLAAGLWLVGSYNTISIVFLVMFIGLGVDFAIHFCLRIREEQSLNHHNQTSLFVSIRGTFIPLSLCALTSAIGFLGFYPTDYTGLAELGIISAAGMLMGLLATFTVIPVFFFFFGYPKSKLVPTQKKHRDDGIWLVKHHKVVISSALALLVIMGVGASQMKFDFSTLVLKSPNSESVKTLEDIQKRGLTSSYQMMMLAETPQQAEQWQQELQQLTEVSNALSINSFLPQDRNAKVTALTQALNTAKSSTSPIVTPTQLADSLASSSLKDTLSPNVLSWLSNTDEAELYRSISIKALQPLAAMQQQFTQMLKAPAPTLADMPNSLTKRYYNKDYALVVAYPSGDMRDVEQLDQFIQAVQQIAPNATGRPVAEQQVGNIITRAFMQAIGYSLTLIALVLLFALKYKRDVALTFVPLLLTTVSTMAVAHWSGFSLNMANIIVIPLIFGLGVDNGIHIVERFRSVGSVKAFYQSSTPKAAILSSLTTMVTFGSLLFAEHRGMFSIGFLLTIAIGFLLVYSLTVLPALLFTVKSTNDGSSSPIK